MIEWDAIVVGAGPAGSVAARQLALRGHRVLLVDKATFPREKVCGCCLNPAAIVSLARLGLPHILSALHAVPLGNLRLAAGGRVAVLPLAGGMAVSRSTLDLALMHEARRAGVEFAQGCAARLGPALAHGRMVMLNDQTVCAKLIIAADGLGGTLLRDEPGVEQYVSPRSRMGAGVILEQGPDWVRPGLIHMACGKKGYVGLVRLEDGRVNVAAALDPTIVRESGGPGMAAARVLGEAGFDAVPQLLEHRWHGTPRLTHRRVVEGDRLLVVGDAAGYVEPFTGEGIAWAIASGAAVTPIAHRMIRGKSIAGGAWAQAHAALLRSRQAKCRMIASALRWPGLTKLAVRVLSAMPWLARPAMRSIDSPLSCAEGVMA